MEHLKSADTFKTHGLTQIHSFHVVIGAFVKWVDDNLNHDVEHYVRMLTTRALHKGGTNKLQRDVTQTIFENWIALQEVYLD